LKFSSVIIISDPILEVFEMEEIVDEKTMKIYKEEKKETK